MHANRKRNHEHILNNIEWTSNIPDVILLNGVKSDVMCSVNFPVCNLVHFAHFFDRKSAYIPYWQ